MLACGCRGGSCRCNEKMIELKKGVDLKIAFPCGSYGDCDYKPEEIASGVLTIECYCCDHEIITLTNFEFTKCDCFLVVAAADLNAVKAGTYRYDLVWTTKAVDNLDPEPDTPARTIQADQGYVKVLE